MAYALLGGGLWRAMAVGAAVQTGRIGRYGLLVALILHGIGLQQSIMAGAYLHLNWALALAAATWLGLIVYWLEDLLSRMDGLRLLLMPAACLVTALAALFPRAQVVTHADSTWLRVHLLLALAAYGLMTVAALHALLMAALDRRLHHPLAAPGGQAGGASLLVRVLDSLPPLLPQERLLFRMIWAGFVLLTVAVVTGSMVSMTLTGKIFPFDHKTVFTLLSWWTFGMLLYTGTQFVLDVILNRT